MSEKGCAPSWSHRLTGRDATVAGCGWPLEKGGSVEIFFSSLRRGPYRSVPASGWCCVAIIDGFGPFSQKQKKQFRVAKLSAAPVLKKAMEKCFFFFCEKGRWQLYIGIVSFWAVFRVNPISTPRVCSPRILPASAVFAPCFFFRIFWETTPCLPDFFSCAGLSALL